MSMTMLEEITKVMLAVPSAHASPEEIAAWYELKAGLLEHIAAEGGQETAEAHRQAELAHRRSAELRGEPAGPRAVDGTGRRHRPGTVSRLLRGRRGPSSSDAA